MTKHLVHRPDTLGVPLDELAGILNSLTIQTSWSGNALMVDHEHYSTRIEVLPPESEESENGSIRAVIRMTTPLPESLLPLIEGKEARASTYFNTYAALGALCLHQGKVCVGSRLTIYDKERAWSKLHLPLLMINALYGVHAIAGALCRQIANEEPEGGDSAWTESDLEQVEGYLSRMCLCTSGGLGLTAEFGLNDGAVSAIAGDNKTALFQLMTHEAHPELGAGLTCLLQMPHRIKDESRLHQVCLQLNNMEMAAHDLPPHFGAWCAGNLSDNPSYICFLPNALHDVKGIAVNVAFWAVNRAHWADGMLASLGVVT